MSKFFLRFQNKISACVCEGVEYIILYNYGRNYIFYFINEPISNSNDHL